jgi:hypothetical protein
MNVGQVIVGQMIVGQMTQTPFEAIFLVKFVFLLGWGYSPERW